MLRHCGRPPPSLPAPGTVEPADAAGLRGDYESFLNGTPNLQHYSQRLQWTIWQNRNTFSGRLPRLGALRAWQFLRAGPVDGEPSLLFRATHDRGVIYVRFSRAQDQRISRLVWWHL